MQLIKSRGLFAAGLFAILLNVHPAASDTIDFESGFSGLQGVGVVVTATNTVTISTDYANTGPGGNLATVVGYAVGPGVAFAGANGVDTVTDPAVAGNFFLTDENADSSAVESRNFFFEFAQPVANISLDLYDFLADGGGVVGGQATLIAYSDSFTTSVGQITNTIVAGEADGNIKNLAVTNPSGPIVSAALIFSETGENRDEGIGIDNITFDTVVVGSYALAKSLIDGPRKPDGTALAHFDLDGLAGNDTGAVIGAGLSFAQHYTAEIRITNTGTTGGLADLGFADRILQGFELSGAGEAFFDSGGDPSGDVTAVCNDGDCDGLSVSGTCTATLSGPVGKKGAIDPRSIVIEADALAEGGECIVTLYLATTLASKKKGNNPAVYHPERCLEGTSANGPNVVFPVTLNPGLIVVDETEVETVSGPHDPIHLEVLGACP